MIRRILRVYGYRIGNGGKAGFGSFWTARRTLAGYEAMAMIRKGQVRTIGGGDIRVQATFIARCSKSPPERLPIVDNPRPAPNVATEPFDRTYSGSFGTSQRRTC